MAPRRRRGGTRRWSWRRRDRPSGARTRHAVAADGATASEPAADGIGAQGADTAEGTTSLDHVLRNAEASRAEQPHQEP